MTQKAGSREFGWSVVDGHQILRVNGHDGGGQDDVSIFRRTVCSMPPFL
jgi:hypothetical protein